MRRVALCFGAAIAAGALGTAGLWGAAPTLPSGRSGRRLSRVSTYGFHGPQALAGGAACVLAGIAGDRLGMGVGVAVDRFTTSAVGAGTSDGAACAATVAAGEIASRTGISIRNVPRGPT